LDLQLPIAVLCPFTPSNSTPCVTACPLLLRAYPPFSKVPNRSQAAIKFPWKVNTSCPVSVAYTRPCASFSSVLLGSVGSSQILVVALGASCKEGSQPHANTAPSIIGMAKQPRTIPSRLGCWVKSCLDSTPCTAKEPSLPNAAEMPWHVQRYFVGNISAGIYDEGRC
jgi:hypothetical protein